MLEDHKANEVKEVLIDVMLTGSTGKALLWKYQDNGLVDMTGTERGWILTEKGHRWLDEHK